MFDLHGHDNWNEGPGEAREVLPVWATRPKLVPFARRHLSAEQVSAVVEALVGLVLAAFAQKIVENQEFRAEMRGVRRGEALSTEREERLARKIQEFRAGVEASRAGLDGTYNRNTRVDGAYRSSGDYSYAIEWISKILSGDLYVGDLTQNGGEGQAPILHSRDMASIKAVILAAIASKPGLDHEAEEARVQAGVAANRAAYVAARDAFHAAHPEEDPANRAYDDGIKSGDEEGYKAGQRAVAGMDRETNPELVEIFMKAFVEAFTAEFERSFKGRFRWETQKHATRAEIPHIEEACDAACVAAAPRARAHVTAYAAEHGVVI